MTDAAPPPRMDLEELKRLAKEATPGPWMAAAKPSSVVGWPVVSQTGRVICDVNYVQHSQIDLPVPGDRAFNTESKANAHLIVAAVNSLPALIEEVERLREALQQITNAEPYDKDTRQIEHEVVRNIQFVAAKALGHD